MSDPNPYLAPTSVEERPAALFRSSATSLMWLAGSFASVAAIISCYFSIYVFGYGDATSVFTQTLMATAVLTVPSVAAYFVARLLFQRRFRYTSTPFSLVLAGAILAGVVTCCYLFLSRASSEVTAWGVGVLAAFGVCYVVCAIERLVAGEADSFAMPVGSDANGSDATPAAANAPIFWFSLACLVFGFVAGAAVQTREFMSMVAGGVISAAMLCLMATASYGLASLCVRPARPATIASRLIAALVFTGTLSLSGYLMEFYGVKPGLTRLLVIIPSAILSVLTDRLVRRIRAE